MIGSSIGNYKILEKLNGAETVGVYKAVDVVLDRNVYIKFLGREHSERTAEIFRLEAEVLAKLVHPCVPTLHSLMTLDEQLFMILEFLEGETLDKLLWKQGKFPYEKAVSIFTEVLDCLEFAHTSGITHGDLKIENVFLTETGSVKILSFGTSENFYFDKTNENILPEQKLEIEKFADKDVYAVGKMLSKVLTGDNLISDETGKSAQDLREINSAVPEKIAQVIAKIFRSQADGKFYSAAELRQDLAQSVSNDENLLKDSTVLENSGFMNRAVNNNTAVYSIDFSQNNKKFVKSPLRRNWSKKPSAGKVVADAPINWKLAQKNLWVGGAGILAIIVLHFFFQVSFVTDDLAKIEKVMPEDKQVAGVEPFAKTGKTVKAESSAEIDIFSEQLVDKTDEQAIKTEARAEIKTRKSELRRQTVVSPPVQPQPKLVPPPVIRKKESQETRAERLRRAEKILTGA